MFKTIVTSAWVAACIFNCSGQADSAKMFDHYIGLQANQLIKQIINLNSNNNSSIDNPYLLTYGIYLSRCGFGIEAGAGYNYKKITNSDLPGDRESKINNLFYRIGVGRKVMAGKRIVAGYHLDFAGDYQSDKTFSSQVTNFGNTVDSSATHVTTQIKSYGPGARLSLGFYLAKRLLIGTEVTYYFVKSTEKQNILVTTTTTIAFNNTVTTGTTNSNLKTKTETFNFTIPVALFLIVKF